MNIKQIIYAIIIGLILFSFQTSIYNTLPFFDIRSNLMFVYAICFSFFLERSKSSLITILCLFPLDIWFSSISFYTLIVLPITLFNSYLSEKAVLGEKSVIYSFILGQTLILEFSNAFLFSIFGNQNSFYIFKEHIVGLIIGNFIVSIIIYPIVKEVLVDYKKKARLF